MVYDAKYTVADFEYFRRAVHFMTQNFPHRLLVFVVCTDDMMWSKLTFPEAVSREIDHVTVGIHDDRSHNDSDVTNETTAANSTRAVVVFSEDHGSEEDLAILSSCNHTIMTVGTYGWWGGYLAGGLTTYYRKFPPKTSELYEYFSRKDHFPPQWVGL